VRSIEDELPILSDSVTGAQAYAAAKVHSAFTQETLNLFGGIKTWAK
jgi:hypothetical protein